MSREFMAAYVAAVKANDRMYRHGESINGLKITRVGIADYRTFEKHQEVWESGEQLSAADFIKRFCEEGCTAWERNDEFGNIYAGQYWNPSDGSDPPDNAGTLTKQRNAEMAASLPYSNHFKLWFMNEVLCPAHNESVQALNSFCSLIEDVRTRIPALNY